MGDDHQVNAADAGEMPDALETMDHEELGKVLVDRDEKIGQRMRAVFFLRSKGGESAVVQLCNALAQKGDSSLLRHELAFVLGQMQMRSAIPTLNAVLRDTEDCAVVRHEAAEALGAIGAIESLEVLDAFCEDERPEVSETCKIAVRRLRWLQEQSKDGEQEAAGVVGGADDKFNSVDPAPLPETPQEDPEAAAGQVADIPTDKLVEDLLDTSLELFQRYRAMFGLRNRGGEEAVLGLARGLQDSSALFRHEIAYVLGQMEHPASIPALSECLRKSTEHGMVRHEAAEALGAIGSDECVKLLVEYLHDPEPLVSESCETALDSIEYWTTFERAALEDDDDDNGEAAVGVGKERPAGSDDGPKGSATAPPPAPSQASAEE